jgi:hypothetical protein
MEGTMVRCAPVPVGGPVNTSLIAALRPPRCAQARQEERSFVIPDERRATPPARVSTASAHRLAIGPVRRLGMPKARDPNLWVVVPAPWATVRERLQ